MSKWICSSCENLIETEMEEPSRCTNCDNKKWQKVEEGTEPTFPTKSMGEASTLRIFQSGATRSVDVEEFRFDLAPACATRREAKVWAEGAKIHGANNWKKGFPIHVCLNHLEYHLNKYKEGDRTEDHLAKIAVNIEMVMFFEEEDSFSNTPNALLASMYTEPIVEFYPPLAATERKNEEDALREIHEDIHKGDLPRGRKDGDNLEKKINKILEWIKFNGEEMKCKSRECKFY